jgi:hypothetical protein
LPDLGLSLEGPLQVSVVWARARSELRDAGVVTEYVGRGPEAGLDAVRAGIEERRERGQQPRSLLILTNARRGQLNRRLAARALKGTIEASQIAVGGPEVLSAALDARPDLRLRVPAVLGLRDLGALIPEVVREASSFDLAAARELAGLFVATGPYLRALEVLARHSFVVLTGPPEMGKTAIARTLSLAQLTAGWEVHECTDPDQVFRAHARERAQVFVADDAFGSTEFKPESAERWARELHRVLTRMDERHWLIWTSRPALMRAGLRRVHRERGLERFPQPADVQVDASELDRHEKALILFRHARAADLSYERISLVREEGPRIVAHPYFTPERIRRFVSSTLPQIEPGPGTAPMLVLRELRSPTTAMASSLQALGPEHRDLLVAMLDAPGDSVAQRELAAALRRHHDDGLSRPPAELFDRLADHFLKVSEVAVKWVHPSWRDLVIEDLAVDAARRRRFLARCRLDGLLVAASRAGGAEGVRSLPLLVDDADWDTATGRMWELIPILEAPELARLLWSLGEAIDAAKPPRQRAEAQSLSRTALELSVRRFEGGPVSVSLLAPWFEVAARLDHPPAPPALETTWAELLPAPPLELESVEELERIDEWLRLAQLLERHMPEQLARFGYPDRYEAVFKNVVVAAHVFGARPEATDERAIVMRIFERLPQSVREGAPHAVALWLGMRMAASPEEERAASYGTSYEVAASYELDDREHTVVRILRDLG